MRSGDTIVALSSGAPPSGVAVIRLSGPDVKTILQDISGTPPEPRRLTLRPIGRDSLLDRGLVAWFPAPHSFTGEDCAELQVHGSPAGVRAILKLITSNGARLAEAGEFTRRAFENSKLDLVEIEGLGDLLEAETENQRRQALARFEGGLSQRVDAWRDQLLDLRAEIEARLDFSDEGDVAEALPASFGDSIAALRTDIATALASLEHGRIVREGIRVALAGPPNAGKSSLLNALAKSDIAIVTDEAGTTRDVREVPLDIGGQLYILLDLAGLRDTDSKAEAEGVRRARQAIEQADIVLWLHAPDITGTPPANGDRIIKVGTKHDLGTMPGMDVDVSVQSGAGLDVLLQRIEAIGQTLSSGEPALLSRERDRLALESATAALEAAARQLAVPELAAESLRIASQALERLVGRLDAERVLDRLFASFCIGK
ncbi:tRNA uridine-5-carboxymethylaminomethyl(34) synthesis GTPase MnmE [Devosia ginsengisoli]|uniref:tRNA uridine-5-carboxymethylaminomethyl(34) synthesis GTPase MnmE n=1 Tax=Devosia ginsengisoli TaxID=400770 RepID=UPI0026EA8C5F|nr:tRNA uridine-5-carboxymethylaminomethyl(34) synthesis GTPase MnmE [Devosia ginsengisoli]MCR6671110.1 tRNA uridine-5-carboxymethylaminomethyl(34) synthesis GTPase MnmE [Devosia ginsengisoli]